MENIIRQDIDMEKILSSKEDDLFYFVNSNSLNSEKITAPKYSYWKSVFRIFSKKKSNWVMIILLALILILSFVLPLFLPYNEFENITVIGSKNLNPIAACQKFGFSIKWIFGTGKSGNSIFLGVWASARTSLILSFSCAIINMVLGIIIGAIWGYNKAIDGVLNVIYNIIANVPYILLISVLIYVIGHGMGSFIFALTITGWLGIAYFFRNQVMVIRDREYNLASRCLGTPMIRVVTRNVLPFLVSVIVTILATELPAYISMEVFLTYIDVGLSAEIPSLGRMIESAQDSFVEFWWAFWFPVAVASLVTITLYLLGQNLADASDPRSHME